MPTAGEEQRGRGGEGKREREKERESTTLLEIDCIDKRQWQEFVLVSMIVKQHFFLWATHACNICDAKSECFNGSLKQHNTVCALINESF